MLKTKLPKTFINEFQSEGKTFSFEVSVYSSPEGTPSNFAAVKAFNRLTDYGLSTNLIVHYKEVDGSTGFILTAFVMSDKRLNKRFSGWHRLR